MGKDVCPDDSQDIAEVLSHLKKNISTEDREAFMYDISFLALHVWESNLNFDVETREKDEFDVVFNFFVFCMSNKKILKTVMSLEEDYGEILSSCED